MARYHRGWSKGWRKSTRGAAGEWFDSNWELQYMDEMDRDPLVARWTRHHGLRIPYRKWWGTLGYYEPDFLVEIMDDTKELREVKGEHLFRDANTARKLKAGDAFCRQRGMKFRVITKSVVNPEMWTPGNNIQVEIAEPAILPIKKEMVPIWRGYLILSAAIFIILGIIIWLVLK